MRVLLTRPLEDSRRTARALAERGHEAVIAPLSEIKYFDGAELSLDGIQAVLATSSNGVRAFARLGNRRDIPLFAVGTQTAATAKQEGFCYIHNAQGDAAALASLVRARLQPEDGALFQAAGTNASPVLLTSLTEAGFELRTHPLYDVIEVTELPLAAADALRSDALDAALFYSPRSARLFAGCVKQAGLANNCKHVLACCISHETADALDGLSFAELHTAPHPDQESLLAPLPRPPKGGRGLG